MNNIENITIRKSKVEDLESFFTFQIDPEGIFLAAFTPKEPGNKTAYLEKYGKLLDDESVIMLTIFLNEKIVGSVSKFVMFGDAEITYWIDKEFWGRGVATVALNKLLEVETTRPIFGRVAFDNLGSQKVLEKCGFIKIGTDSGFANARQSVIEEYIYKLS